jgi:type II secretory pathway component PulF
MPIFTYEAVNKDGETITGELNATSKEEAVGVLTRKKLVLDRIEEIEVRDSAGLSKHLFERFTALDRIVLVRNLAVTIKAGLSIVEALEILITDATKKITGEILMSAKTNVQNGQSLSKTFEFYHKYFPSIFVGMIKAGETSGQLDKTLDELSGQLTKEYNLIKKVKSALAYPLILLVASLGIVALLLIFVLPRLTRTFAQSQTELPMITKVLVSMSAALTKSYWLDAGVIILLIGFISFFRKTVAGRAFFSFLAFHTPVVRNLVKKIILVRLTRTLGSLIASGLSIVESLELCRKVVGNPKYEKAIDIVINDIKNGVQISEAFRKFPDLFPRFLTSLIGVGEKTGTLESVLKTFADFYDDEVDGALKDLTTFLEPMMLLFMGLLVGLIAVSILMPIYQLVGKFV